MDIATLKVEPAGKFKLKKRKPDDTHGISKSQASKGLPVHVEKLAALHDLLYAEHKRSVLIVLQGMDAAGKDGTIKHVMSGVNPQGCSVTSFKEPTLPEQDHDFLWRVHAAVPGKGTMGIFNRSHYEDVLITRVHKLVPRKLLEKRYAEINAFEQTLNNHGTRILKFFLHMSSEEQLKRFNERLTDPRKNWKASPADFKERNFFAQYQDAYEEVLDRCSTKDAPWYVIPSDHKWFRNFAVAEVIVRTMESFGMKYPEAATTLVASSSIA
ncbi:MAG TPA: polyphosphate kinase 2 family protein [Bryobacteraceae bacterium]|jgi:PPK2 family polyphosphate:nucleotide phosphotransferase|nr:polyphosphate kinase 2 family protein [Bryobacteraceae bacterium]